MADCIRLSIPMNEQITLKNMYYQEEKPETWRNLIKDRQRRIEFASEQKIIHLQELMPHNGRCAVVGAAPSVKDHLDEISKYTGNDMIISLNGSHDFLVKNGIAPRIHILFEIDLENVETSTGGPPHKDVYYYICSHCNQSVFKQLEGYRRVLWHCFDEPPEYQSFVLRLFPGEFMVGGGFVTFFRAVNIGSILGFRHFDLFGCDCSFEGEESHYKGYHTKNSETKMVVAAGTKDNYRMFGTTPSLSFLASEIMRFCDTNQRGITLKVHGAGMLRHMHQMEYPELYKQKEV
jgi:hypothetical protein